MTSNRKKAFRLALLGGSAVLLGIAAVVACSAPAGTPYGNPNTLDRKNLPGEGGAEPLTCGGDAAVEAGVGANCGVSFSRDLYPYFADAGGCALPTCHAAGKNDPPIDTSSADKLYASLRSDKCKAAGLPYLPPGDGGIASDGGGTSLLCNLRGECGRKMPEGAGKDPSNDDLCRMQAWIACGAPNN